MADEIDEGFRAALLEHLAGFVEDEEVAEAAKAASHRRVGLVEQKGADGIEQDEGDEALQFLWQALEAHDPGLAEELRGLELGVEAAQVGQFVEAADDAVVLLSGGAEFVLVGLADGFEVAVAVVGDDALDGGAKEVALQIAGSLAAEHEGVAQAHRGAGDLHRRGVGAEEKIERHGIGAGFHRTEV